MDSLISDKHMVLLGETGTSVVTFYPERIVDGVRFPAHWIVREFLSDGSHTREVIPGKEKL